MLKYLALFFFLGSFLLATTNNAFIKSAQNQIGKTLTYNPEYRYIKYPMGDIPLSTGVCTDVVVHAFRGVKIDLQERIR